MKWAIIVALCLAAWGCAGKEKGADTGTDSDTDTDSDSETETEAYSWFVGSARYDWTDPDRDEIIAPTTEGEKRTIVATVRFPTDSPGDETPSTHGAPFPLLVYSPGACCNAEMYESVLGDLVAHGYVVVGVDSPSLAGSVTIGGETIDCYSFPTDPTGLDLRDISVAGPDLEFAVDQALALGEAEARFAGIIDAERIGVFGHSLGGGAASWEFFSDDRVDAFMLYDADAWFWAGVPRPQAPDPRSMLVFNAGLHVLATDMDQQESWAGLTGPRFAVEVASANHGSFIDGMGGDGFAALVQAFSRTYFDIVFRDADISTLTELTDEFPTASVVTNAGSEPAAGTGFPCGAQSCDNSTEECCLPGDGSACCQAIGSACAATSSACWDASDCADDQICCADAQEDGSLALTCWTGDTCPAGAGIMSVQTCSTTSECATGTCEFLWCEPYDIAGSCDDAQGSLADDGVCCRGPMC